MQNTQQKKAVSILALSLLAVAFLASCTTPAENAATNNANVVNPDVTKTVNTTNPVNGVTTGTSDAKLEISGTKTSTDGTTGTSDAKLEITGTTTATDGTTGSSTAKLEISGSTPVSTAPVVNDEVQKLLANQDKLNALVKEGDVTKCKTLEMAQYQVSCEANILANKAKSKTDKEVCKAASTPEALTQCESVVSTK